MSEQGTLSDGKLVLLASQLIDETSRDLAQTRALVEKVTTQNVSLESIATELRAENAMLQARMEEVLLEAEQVRLGAEAEMDRALSACSVSSDEKNRAVAAEKRVLELQEQLLSESVARRKLQAQVQDLAQENARMKDKVDEATRYARTLEEAMKELQ